MPKKRPSSPQASSGSVLAAAGAALAALILWPRKPVTPPPIDVYQLKLGTVLKIDDPDVGTGTFGIMNSYCDAALLTYEVSLDSGTGLISPVTAAELAAHASMGHLTLISEGSGALPPDCGGGQVVSATVSGFAITVT